MVSLFQVSGNIKVLAGVGLLAEGSEGQFKSRLIQALDGIKLHVEAGLRSMFPRWLLTESLSASGGHPYVTSCDSLSSSSKSETMD